MNEQNAINLKCSNCDRTIVLKTNEKIVNSIKKNEFDLICTCGSVFVKTEKKNESIK